MLALESILLWVSPKTDSRIQIQVVDVEDDVRMHQWGSKEVTQGRELIYQASYHMHTGAESWGNSGANTKHVLHNSPTNRNSQSLVKIGCKRWGRDSSFGTTGLPCLWAERVPLRVNC